MVFVRDVDGERRHDGMLGKPRRRTAVVPTTQVRQAGRVTTFRAASERGSIPTLPSNSEISNYVVVSEFDTRSKQSKLIFSLFPLSFLFRPPANLLLFSPLGLWARGKIRGSEPFRPLGYRKMRRWVSGLTKYVIGCNLYLTFEILLYVTGFFLVRSRKRCLGGF